MQFAAGPHVAAPGWQGSSVVVVVDVVVVVVDVVVVVPHEASATHCPKLPEAPPPATQGSV
jgi:hypothetical protein